MNSCIIERCKTVKHLTLNMVSGETADTGKETVEVEPCGIPLFSDNDRKLQICKGCRELWSAPGNEITDNGLNQLIAAGVK